MIGAGERGGFLNSQFAGAAALVPTNGGTFAGEGGELNRIKSDYDRNIDDLKSKQVMAVNMARQAAETAIRTGKSEDLSRMMKLKDQAMQMSQLVNDANAKKIETINNYEKSKQTRIDRTVSTLVGSVYAQMTGDKNKDSALIKQIALDNKVDEGLLLSAVTEYNNEQKKTDLDLLSKKQSISKNIKKGETYKDPDTGITIIGTQDPTIEKIQKVIGNNEWQINYDMTDPANPVELSRIDLGPKWKGGGSSTGGDIDTPIDEAITQTVEYLNDLKALGNFNDTTYSVALSTLASEYGIEDQARYNSLGSLINQRLGALDGSTDNNQNNSQSPTTTNNTDGSGLGFIGGVKKYLFNESDDRIRFSQLDNKFRKGEQLNPQENTEYFRLLNIVNQK